MKRIYTSCLGYKKILFLSLFLLSSTNSNAQACHSFWCDISEYFLSFFESNDFDYSSENSSYQNSGENFSAESVTVLKEVVVTGEKTPPPSITNLIQSSPLTNWNFNTIKIDDFSYLGDAFQTNPGGGSFSPPSENLIKPTKKEAEDNKKKEPTLEESIAKAFDASKVGKLDISIKDISEKNSDGIQKAEINALFTTNANNKYGLTSKLDSNSSGQQLSGKWEGSIAGNETKMSYDNNSKNFTINFGADGKSGINLSTNFNSVQSSFLVGDNKGAFVAGKFDSNGNFGGSAGLGNQSNNISTGYDNQGNFTGNVNTNLFNNANVSFGSTISITHSSTDASIEIGINLTNK